MREAIDKKSMEQGFQRSRLPRFTPEEVEYIRGTYDFMGINYYTSVVYKKDENLTNRDIPSYENDLGYVSYQKDQWKRGASPWLRVS
jgi:beta-glucosidase/6-phospho-beta-glucosidase/beta-galactosidase